MRARGAPTDATALGKVHACLGCPLRVEGELVGVLAADALDPHAFDQLDARFLAALGALAGAAPPLRERLDDVPVLVGHFCEAMQPRLGVGPIRFRPEALAALSRYSWPGNVRELENLVSRLALTAAGETSPGDPVIIRADMLGREFGGDDARDTESPPPTAADTRSLAERLDDYQRAVIRRTLDQNDGNWAATARALGLHRSNLHHRASRLGLLG